MLVYIRYRPEALTVNDKDILNGVYDVTPAQLRQLYDLASELEPDHDILDVSVVQPKTFNEIAAVFAEDCRAQGLVA